MEIGVLGAAAPERTRGRGLWRTLADRLAPTLVFGTLDILVARVVVDDFKGASGGLTLHQTLVLIGATLYFVFVTLMILLFLIRPPARAMDARASSWVLAMLGTFGLVIAPLLPHGPVLVRTGTAGEFVQSTVLALALGLALVTLHTLGHSFSLTPQARSLVSRGPYRLVRHPLYLCEAMAMLCMTVASGRLTILIVAMAVLAAQVRRAQLEERLLSKTFPEYEEVFAGVRHFLPGIF